MRRDPYHRRSVWIDILGIVFAGAVLLGGAGYLLYHAGGAASDTSGGYSRGGGAASPVRGYQSARRPRPSRGSEARSGAAGPLLSSRSRSSPSGAAAPFSKEWRAEATPSLTGPPASSGGRSQRGGGASPSLSGTVDPPSHSFGQFGSRGPQHGAADRSAGSGWRAEARRLGGQARALSSQLRQMDRQSAAQGNASSSNRSAGSGTEARTADGGVPPPPSVPIDDHLHWLLVAGVLWGAWRLWRGG